MKEIWLYDLHRCQRDESLETILRGKYGWNTNNAGPLVAFPLQRTQFLAGVPGHFRTGDYPSIPWTPQRLHKHIDLRMKELQGRAMVVRKTAERVKLNSQELSDTASMVDAIATCCLMLTGLGATTWQAGKAIKAGQEMMLGMRKAGVFLGSGLYNRAKNVAGLDPAAFVGKKTVWYQTLGRHLLSLTSPSYWAALATSCWTGQWDLWLYGSGKIDNDIVAKSMRSFTKTAMAHALSIAAMKRQSEMRFYRYRLTASRAVQPFPSLPELMRVR